VLLETSRPGKRYYRKLAHPANQVHANPAYEAARASPIIRTHVSASKYIALVCLVCIYDLSPDDHHRRLAQVGVRHSAVTLSLSGNISGGSFCAFRANDFPWQKHCKGAAQSAIDLDFDWNSPCGQRFAGGFLGLAVWNY